MATTTTTTTATPTTTSFNEVNRKQAFNGLVQEMILEPSKQYNDLELYLDDLVEYLHPQMDKMLPANGSGIQLCWSVQVKYSTTLMKTVDYEDDENWFGCGHDQDNDDEKPVYLPSGKLPIPNREQLAAKIQEAHHIILERNSGSIRSKSNVVSESIGDVCFKVINQKNKLK